MIIILLLSLDSASGSTNTWPQKTINAMPKERPYLIKDDLCKTYTTIEGRKYPLSYERKIVGDKWIETD